MADNWYTKGCDECRHGILSASWPPPIRLFSLDEWHSYLHRCDACDAYWLYGQREAHVIDDAEVQSIVENSYFNESALEPLPYCLHKTSNRSLVQAILDRSNRGVVDGAVREFLNDDPSSFKHNSRYLHIASGAEWTIYLPDHAYSGDVIVNRKYRKDS